MEKASIIFALFPHGRELVRCRWCFAFEAWPNPSFQGAGQRGEKISRHLSRRAFEAHIDEKGFRGTNVSKVDLATFVKQSYFVENLRMSVNLTTCLSNETYIVDGLRGLIDCHERRCSG